MRFINAVVISLALTICSWKCGEVNAAPYYNNGSPVPDPDTGKYFSGDKHHVSLNINSIYTSDQVKLTHTQRVDGSQNVVGTAKDGGVYKDDRSQTITLGKIHAAKGVDIVLAQSSDPLKQHTHKPDNFFGRLFNPYGVQDATFGTDEQIMLMKQPIVSDGPVNISTSQSSG